MPIDLPVILLIAIVALLVAATVAQRAGAHADHVAGRHPVKGADRRGSLGALVDVLDRSVAAYTIRKRLGLSTLTRAERRAADQRTAAIAQAEEIRRLRSGPPSAAAPKRIVVAGSGAAARATSTAGAPRAARSTVSVELLAAGLGLAVVVGIVIGIWPRERGDVAGATGVPAVTTAPSLVPTPSGSASPEAIGS